MQISKAPCIVSNPLFMMKAHPARNVSQDRPYTENCDFIIGLRDKKVKKYADFLYDFELPISVSVYKNNTCGVHF